MIRFIVIIVLAAVLGTIGINFYLQPNSFRGCGDTPTGTGNCQAADAIVAVSGGDTNARADAAIDLYKNGWAKTLIFSGAAQDKTGPSNAEAMQTRAIAAGVPASVIIIDGDSETTSENAENTEAIFTSNDIHSIILVTSGYHQRRAELEFTARDDGVIIFNHPTHDKDWTVLWWIAPRGWWLATGELIKIAAFYAHGVIG